MFKPIVCLFVFLFAASPAAALDLNAHWDHVMIGDPAVQVEGYRLFIRAPGQPYDYTAPYWTGPSNISGPFPAPAPNGTIHLVVRAFDGALESADSAEVSYTSPGLPAPVEGDTVIIDNGDAGTSFTGTWIISSASGAYGSDSVWSKDGSTYTYTFSPAISGEHEIAIWWTYHDNRTTVAPVTLSHDGGTTDFVVDQHAGGGAWHALGTFGFTVGENYTLTVTSVINPSATTSVDAIRITSLMAEEDPPTLPAPGVQVISCFEPRTRVTVETLQLDGTWTVEVME